MATAKSKAESSAPLKGEVLPALSQAGRPTSYRIEYADQAKKLCLLGSTDKQLAEFFEVSVSTINNWKLDYPAFLESIRAGKVVADAEVASSLYRRATGEYAIIEKAYKNGQGEYEKIELKTYVEPDTNAARLWLLNRRPENWRDKQEIEHSGSVIMDTINSARQRLKS